jgi:hypothetical protein
LPEKTHLAAHLINPKSEISSTYEEWSKFQKADIRIESEPIQASTELVLLYLANPRNEDWYPSTKSSIKLIVTEQFKTEPPMIESLGLYEAAKGQAWEIVANTFLYNQIYYDHIALPENNYLIREIASPNEKNDITWVVFYHLSQLGNKAEIRMEVFFIGFPKFGIQYASGFVKRLLAMIFKPILRQGFQKLKKDAEAKQVTNPNVHS